MNEPESDMTDKRVKKAEEQLERSRKRLERRKRGSGARVARRRRWLLRCLFGGVALLLLAFGIFQFLRPQPTNGWSEIYQGVFYYADEAPEGGRMMAVRFDPKAPGVDFFIRPYADEPLPENHFYRLILPDIEVMAEGLEVFMNATRYWPDSIFANYPGAPVSPVETLVVDGIPSHRHAHSYLLWWDDAWQGTMELTKPPSDEGLQRARLAIGMQGVLIQNGVPNYGGLGDVEVRFSRTFIGIDDAGLVYLMVFENVSGYEMIDTALALGVLNGGQLDSGNASWMVIGGGAKGVRWHTGIRNLRPIAAYLGLRAQPLENK